MNEPIKTAVTLQQCKDQIAIEHGFDNWSHMFLLSDKYDISDYHTLAAEQYATQQTSELQREVERLREMISEIKAIHESRSNIEAKHVHWESVAFGMYRKAEQALKDK